MLKVLDASEERLLLSVLASLAGVEVVDIVDCRARVTRRMSAAMRI